MCSTPATASVLMTFTIPTMVTTSPAVQLPTRSSFSSTSMVLGIWPLLSLWALWSSCEGRKPLETLSSKVAVHQEVLTALILCCMHACMYAHVTTATRMQHRDRLFTWTLIFCQSMLCALDLRGLKLLLRQPSPGQAVGGMYLPSSNLQVLLVLHLLQVKSI